MLETSHSKLWLHFGDAQGQWNVIITQGCWIRNSYSQCAWRQGELALWTHCLRDHLYSVEWIQDWTVLRKSCAYYFDWLKRHGKLPRHFQCELVHNRLEEQMTVIVSKFLYTEWCNETWLHEVFLQLLLSVVKALVGLTTTMKFACRAYLWKRLHTTSDVMWLWFVWYSIV